MARHHTLAKLLVLACLVNLTAGAQSPWNPPVGRSTADRDADLLDALIAAGRFDDAIEFCITKLSQQEPESDLAAKWAIRHCQVLAARQLRSNQFDDADIDQVQAPVSEQIRAYPDQRRRLFLDAQMIAVVRDAALHSVLRAAVLSSADARDAAVRRLLKATTEMESLSNRVADQRAQWETATGSRDPALVSDLVRLQQELLVDAVSLDLMQTELFSPGSDDRVAAATKAEQSALDAIATLPAGTQARREVERLRVEAIIRSGQLRRADLAMDELVQRLGEPLPTNVEAMGVRLDVASGRLSKAQQRLEAFYGQSPATAPRSIEMDLARLEFLLNSNRTELVGDWLDTIEQRGGGYARRRAEALSLAIVRSGDAHSAGRVDPSIVAAQGQDWLRRGDPARGGQLLAAAAEAEKDPNRAVERATQAAAALLSADRLTDAIDILTQTTTAHPRAVNSAAANLQAVYLASSLDQEDIADRLEAMLQGHLRQWPGETTADAARAWLAKILSSQDRHLEAAEVVTSLPREAITPESIASILDHWRTAFRSSDSEARSFVSQRLHAAFAPLIETDAAFSAYRLAAALWMERDALATLPRFDDPSPIADFVNAFIEFRNNGRITPALKAPPPQWLDDAAWRLMQDGRTETTLRSSIAELLFDWTDTSQASLDHAERLIWAGNSDQAIAVIRQLIQAAPDVAEITRRAATLLGSSRDIESRKVAVQLWDELAAGTRPGSTLWHQAKLAAIKLLQSMGEDEQARRRAKYILLTVPSIDEEFQWQYEAAVL